jgi:threonine dehydrogenase-like Zn-dependent dehydrogenase
VVRALTAGRADVAVTAVDIDAARLEHLASVAGPLAASKGLAFESLNSNASEPRGGFTRVGVMVPSPALAAAAIEMAADGAIVDFFAGFAIGTTAPIDVDLLLQKRVYVLGTSGSMISDMKAVLGRLQAGQLDTNISVYAVSGMAGVADALESVRARTSGGKIVIYPQLPDVGLVTLSQLEARYPSVADKLAAGMWTRAAEDELLGLAGGAVA